MFGVIGLCRDDLGMSSGAIPDTALSASSSFDEKSVGPLNSRYQYSSTFPFLVSSSDTAEMQDRFACMTCLELLHLVRNHMRTVSIRNIPRLQCQPVVYL